MEPEGSSPPQQNYSGKYFCKIPFTTRSRKWSHSIRKNFESHYVVVVLLNTEATRWTCKWIHATDKLEGDS